MIVQWSPSNIQETIAFLSRLPKFFVVKILSTNYVNPSVYLIVNGRTTKLSSLKSLKIHEKHGNVPRNH